MDRGGRFYRNNMNLARALMYSAIFFLAPSMGSGEVAKPIACPAHITSKAEALPGSPPYLAQKLSVQESYGNLPHYFIENRGQMDKRVSYFTNAQRHAIYFTIDGILFSPHQVKTGTQMKAAAKTAFRSTETRGTIQASPSSAIKLQPLEMCPGVKLVGLEPQEGKVNYLIGNDRKKWHSDIPAYGAVLYREAYPGIDLKFYGVSRKLEYDIIVKPGGDLTKVKFQYQGVKGLKVTKEGDLSITLPDGSELMQQKPVVYQQIAGQAVAREGSFRFTVVQPPASMGLK